MAEADDKTPAPATCALCRLRPSTPTGEHVLPRAVIRDLFPLSAGPFTTTTGSGPDRVTQQFDSVKLPCCRPCNDTLASRFENPGQAPAVRLLTAERPALAQAEAEQAALWLLKTWLLLVHPQARYQPSTPRPLPWERQPDGLWLWLIDGSPPPDGLSAWAFHHVQDPARSATDRPPVLALPIVEADGLTAPFRSLDLTLVRTNVVLVLHPGWPLVHPGEANGDVVRLWPAPSPIEALPALTSRPLAFAAGPVVRFQPGADTASLPPLVAGVAPETLAAGLAVGGEGPSQGGARP